MIGDCKASDIELDGRMVNCAGCPRAHSLITDANSIPVKYLYEEDGRYYWDHSVKVGVGTTFWYCRECQTELLFRQIKKEK